MHDNEYLQNYPSLGLRAAVLTLQRVRDAFKTGALCGMFNAFYAEDFKGTDKELDCCPSVLLMTAFQAWPRFTGRHHFPVPHPYLNPVEAFMCTPTEELWGSSEYGRARWDLLYFCIRFLNAEIERRDEAQRT